MEIEEQDPQSQQNRYITSGERWRIVGFWECCKNQSETARYFNVSQSAVSKILCKWRLTNNIEDLTRTGRPEFDGESNQLKIQDLVEENKYITSQEIANNIEISKPTALKQRKNSGFQYSQPIEIPQLNSDHIKKRFQFAETYKDGLINNIMFADETYCELFRNKVGFWHSSELQNCVGKPQQRICLMVWGGIFFDGRTKICIKECGFKFNSDTYNEVLQEYVINPYKINGIISFGKTRAQKQWYFLQDNAPCHRSEQTQTFLKQNGINLIQFPPNSPDLNPIEQIWSIMKTQVEKKQPKNKQQLHDFINEVWDNLNQLHIQNCITKFQQRLREVYDLKGAYY